MTNVFSNPQPTADQAKALYQYDLFNPAAVFKSPDGYTLAYLRNGKEWPPHGALRAVSELTGYEPVAICDPLLGAWKDYEAI